jgi:GNAT superfamily N-acetyltransferase
MIGEARIDLVLPLTSATLSSRSHGALRNAAVQVDFLSRANLPAMIEYQLREFPWWVDPLLEMLPHDMQDVVVLTHGNQVVGSAMAFTPQSTTIAGGLQRRRELQLAIGAFGAVGVARAWRGKGLGMALCEAAAEHIGRTGATHVYIEEVEPQIVPFYGKMGATEHARSLLATRHLPP